MHRNLKKTHNEGRTSLKNNSTLYYVPVFNRSWMSFVLFGKQEPDELCVRHLAILLSRPVSHSPGENAVNHASRYG